MRKLGGGVTVLSVEVVSRGGWGAPPGVTPGPWYAISVSYVYAGSACATSSSTWGQT